MGAIREPLRVAHKVENDIWKASLPKPHPSHPYHHIILNCVCLFSLSFSLPQCPPSLLPVTAHWSLEDLLQCHLPSEVVSHQPPSRRAHICCFMTVMFETQTILALQSVGQYNVLNFLCCTMCKIRRKMQRKPKI